MEAWLQGLMVVLLFVAAAVSLVTFGLRRRYARGTAPQHPAPVAVAAPDLPLAPVSANGAAPRAIPHADWWPVVQQMPDRFPHTAVLGPSGEGKSSLLEALARTRAGLLVVIQPNRKAGEWAGIPVIECDDDGGYTTIAATLQAIRAEFARRGGAMKHGDPGPWLTIVWDEVPLCMRKLKDLAPDLIVDLISAGRPRKMRTILGATSDRVGALGLGGYGDLRESCAVIRLGAFAVAVDPTTQPAAYPTTVEVVGQIIPVERGPILSLRRAALAPQRFWTPPLPADTEEYRYQYRAAERAKTPDMRLDTDTDTDTDTADTVPAATSKAAQRQRDKIKKALTSGLSPTDIVDIVGGNRNKAFALVKAVQEEVEREPVEPAIAQLEVD